MKKKIKLNILKIFQIKNIIKFEQNQKQAVLSQLDKNKKQIIKENLTKKINENYNIDKKTNYKTEKIIETYNDENKLKDKSKYLNIKKAQNKKEEENKSKENEKDFKSNFDYSKGIISKEIKQIDSDEKNINLKNETQDIPNKKSSHFVAGKNKFIYSKKRKV